MPTRRRLGSFTQPEGNKQFQSTITPLRLATSSCEMASIWGRECGVRAPSNQLPRSAHLPQSCYLAQDSFACPNPLLGSNRIVCAPSSTYQCMRTCQEGRSRGKEKNGRDRKFTHHRRYKIPHPSRWNVVARPPPAAEYSEPYLDCPSFGFADVPDAKDIQRLIPQIHPDDDNPFAILSVGEGTFMQTLWTDDGFILEHQLVNTSSHYEIPELASADQVVSAMVPYAFGKNEEWLESFAWRRQELG